MVASEQAILDAASKHLETHETVRLKDIRNLIKEGKPTYKHPETQISHRHISQVLRNNGYVCVAAKTKGYSQYKRKERGGGNDRDEAD